MARFKLVAILVMLASTLLAACGQQTPVPAATAPAGDGGGGGAGEATALPGGAPSGYPSALDTPAAQPTLPGYPGDAGAPAGGQAETVVIVYAGGTITPAEITLKAGTPVEFQSTGTHQPYNDTAPNVFEAPRLASGETWSTTFTEAGTFTILCRLHPSMRATVTVEP